MNGLLMNPTQQFAQLATDPFHLFDGESLLSLGTSLNLVSQSSTRRQVHDHNHSGK